MKKFSFLLFILAILNAAAQNAVITSPAATICLGQSVTLSSSASDPGSTVIVSSDWHISGPDTFTGMTIPGNDFTFTPEIPGIYSVTLINQHEDLSNASSNAANFITVYALPIADFILSDAEGCYGIPYISTAMNLSTHPAGSYTEGSNATGWANTAFQWSFDSQTVTTSNYNETVSVAVSQTISVTLIATDAFGCSSLPFSRQAVVREPVAEFSAPAFVCNGNPVLIHASSSGNIMSYQWIVDGIFQPVVSNPEFIPNWYVVNESTLPIYHNLSLIVEDVMGCRDTSLNSQVIIGASPSANFSYTLMGSAEDSEGNFYCPPVIANFTNTSSGGVGTIDCQWFFAELNLVSSTSPSPQGIQYAFPGTYHVMLVATENTCSDTILIFNFLTIYGPSADVSVNQTGNQGFMEYSFNISDLQNVMSAEWNLGNGQTIPGDLDGFIYVYPESGTYNPSVTLTDQVGCSVVYPLGQIVAGVNGLDEASAAGFFLYPNPAGDQLHLSHIVSGKRLILDLQGKELDPGMYTLNGNQLDISKLRPGMYFLQNGTSVYRFQKQ